MNDISSCSCFRVSSHACRCSQRLANICSTVLGSTLAEVTYANSSGQWQGVPLVLNLVWIIRGVMKR